MSLEVRVLESDDFFGNETLRSGCMAVNRENLLENGGWLRSPDMAGNAFWVVAVEDGAVVGYSALSWCPNDECLGHCNEVRVSQPDIASHIAYPALYISQSAVARRRQRSGIGGAIYSMIGRIASFDAAVLPRKQLMDGLRVDARFRKDYNVLPIFVHVSTRNLPSMMFHTGQGFVPIGVYRTGGFHGEKDYMSLFMCNRDFLVCAHQEGGWSE